MFHGKNYLINGYIGQDHSQDYRILLKTIYSILYNCATTDRMDLGFSLIGLNKLTIRLAGSKLSQIQDFNLVNNFFECWKAF